MSIFRRLLVGVLIAQLVACAAVLGIDDPVNKTGGDAGAAPVAKASARFVETDDTVFDQEEKLTWQRKAPELRLIWEDAKAYCATLSLGPDESAWRLPTKDELLTTFASENAFRVEDRDAPIGWFWSVSESTHQARGAWAVGVGSYANVNDVQSPGRVRCVR